MDTSARNGLGHPVVQPPAWPLPSIPPPQSGAWVTPDCVPIQMSISHNHPPGRVLQA